MVCMKTPPSAPSLKPQGCTNFKLRQLMRRVTHLYDTEMAAIGLKTTQYSLLSLIVLKGPMRPGEVARAMLLDASSVTRNLKPLVDAGWITVTSGSDDRSRTVTATDAGRAKRQEAQRRWKLAQEKINSLLGLDRILALHALVDDSLALLASTEGDDHDNA